MAEDRAQALLEKVYNARDAGHYAYGLELSRDLSRTDPDYCFGSFYQGLFLLYLNRYREAENLFRIAISQSDSERFHNFCYTQLGHLYTESKSFDLAEECYLQAIRLAPNDADGYISLGIMFLRIGDRDRAESTYWQATTCPDGVLSEAYLNLGLLLRGSDRLEEALECASQSIKLQPDYAEAAVLKEDLEMAIMLRAEVSESRH